MTYDKSLENAIGLFLDEVLFGSSLWRSLRCYSSPANCAFAVSVAARMSAHAHVDASRSWLTQRR